MPRKAYTDKLASDICAYISEGNSLRKTCQIVGHDIKTVWRWLHTHSDFMEQYVLAKEESGDSDQDKLDEIAEKVLTGDLEPQQARVAADIIKWSASKKKPKKYGDRLHTEHSGTLSVEQMSDDDRRRRLQELQQELIEAQRD